MVKVKEYKRSLGAFISSEKGQRFFNFAYSIGAAIVIWGALFKILHLPGGNALLSIGMGTEVLMFVLTAFDRPPKEYHWEEVFPALKEKEKKAEAEKAAQEAIEESQAEAAAEAQIIGSTMAFPGGVLIAGNGGNLPAGAVGDAEGAVGEVGGTAGAGGVAGGPVIIGGFGGFGGSVAAGGSGAVGGSGSTSGINGATDGSTAGNVAAAGGSASASLAAPTDFASATQLYIDQITQISTELQHLQEATATLNKVSETLLNSYEAVTKHSDEINDTSNGYVAQMQHLNQNIKGLNTIYEIQLRSVSGQLDAIERVNNGIKDIRDMFEKSAAQSTRYCEETEKMARYMQQLNSVYEKMITAMTINMYRPMMPQEPIAPASNEQGTPNV